jgi:hypothetical protein
MRVRTFVAPVALLAVLALAPAAHADKDTKSAKAAGTKTAAPTEKADEDKAEAPPASLKEGDQPEPTEGGDAEAAKPKTEEEKLLPNDAKELPGKNYYFVGVRFRQTLLPAFMLNLFVSGGPPAVWIPSFGLEGTMRRDGFDTTLYLTYADWSMTPFAFKGKDEGATAWEVVTSKLKLLNVGVDLLWGTDFSKNFSFQYGLTTGLAIVLGDLARVQGKPKAGGDPNNANDIEPCPGPLSSPAPGSQYCDNSNNHYGNYTEPSWFNGGKKPNFYASFGPQIGVRFKPDHRFMARLNLGWDIFQGPFFGLNGSWGL